jgi:hypothetical protein
MSDYPEKSPFIYERPRMKRYQAFAARYAVNDLETLVALYDIDNLESFLPPQPNEFERKVFNQLLGTKGVVGYMDYTKEHNTFELIMSWQELTQNHDLNAISLKRD